MTTTPTSGAADQPEALRLADLLLSLQTHMGPRRPSHPDDAFAWDGYTKASQELRRLHSENAQQQRELVKESHRTAEQKLRADQMTEQHRHQAALNTEARAQQPAPCATCASLARAVMLDQTSFDRKPDCYGIRQITDDEGIEEWEDIRTSPDVAREEARDMMATGRGEIYEVVPLWTTPQPSPTPQADSQPTPALDVAFEAVRKRLCAMQRYSFVLDDDGVVRRVQDRTGNWIEFDEAHAMLDPVAVDAAINSDRAARAPADSVLYDPKAVLDVFNSARAGSEKPVGYLRGILAVIAHWESRPYPHHWMVPARADSELEDAARLDWLLLRISGAEFRRLGVHYSGNARRADVDAARKQGEKQ